MQFGLPSFTFVSGEAVMWVQENVEGIASPTQAVTLLQASGEPSVSGFLKGVSMLGTFFRFRAQIIFVEFEGIQGVYILSCLIPSRLIVPRFFHIFICSDDLIFF